VRELVVESGTPLPQAEPVIKRTPYIVRGPP